MFKTYCACRYWERVEVCSCSIIMLGPLSFLEINTQATTMSSQVCLCLNLDIKIPISPGIRKVPAGISDFHCAPWEVYADKK